MNYKQGFALLTVIALTAILSFTVIALYYRSLSVTIGLPVIIAQQEARQLAISGVQCAIAQLSTAGAEKPAEKPHDKQTAIQSPFLVCNRWQTISLAAGTITWMIVAEEGKININELFDWQSNTWQHPQEPATQEPIKEKRGLYQLLEKVGASLHIERFSLLVRQLLMTRQRVRLNDLSELLLEPMLAKKVTRLWPDPTTTEPALFDLCTLYSRTASLNALYLSPSLCTIMGLRIIQQKVPFSVVAKEGLQAMQATTALQAATWDAGIGKLYAKNYAVIRPFEKLMTVEKSPTVFSVTSIGRRGAAEQKVFAILEVDKAAEERRFVIKKLYLVSGI